MLCNFLIPQSDPKTKSYEQLLLHFPQCSSLIGQCEPIAVHRDVFSVRWQPFVSVQRAATKLSPWNYRKRWALVESINRQSWLLLTPSLSFFPHFCRRNCNNCCFGLQQISVKTGFKEKKNLPQKEKLNKMQPSVEAERPALFFMVYKFLTPQLREAARAREPPDISEVYVMFP